MTLERARLYPHDALLAARVDEFVDALEDFRIIFVPTFDIKDQRQKEAAAHGPHGHGRYRQDVRRA